MTRPHLFKREVDHQLGVLRVLAQVLAPGELPQPTLQPAAPGHPPNESSTSIFACGSYTNPVVLGGMKTNVLDAFDGGFASDASTCVYRFQYFVGLEIANGNWEFLSMWFELPNLAVEILPYVNSAGACTDSSGGWYFDNNGSPTTIILCACSCERINAVEGTMYIVDFPQTCTS